MVDSSRKSSGDDFSQLVVAAAVRHLAAGEIDRFEYRHIANRAGLDAGLVEELWPDLGELLTAFWTTGLGWGSRAGDTGSLRGDLQRFSGSIAASVRTPEGRMLLRSSLTIDEKQEFADTRSGFWRTRFDTAAETMRRAQQRGEPDSGVDLLDAARMSCTSPYFGRCTSTVVLRRGRRTRLPGQRD